MKTEMVFETSVSTKAEPHYPPENPKELLHENSLVRRENIKMRITTFRFLEGEEPKCTRVYSCVIASDA
jgi:hypothetical protein